jgi:hypothetical protein
LAPRICDEIKKYFLRSKRQLAIRLSERIDPSYYERPNLNVWEPGKRKQPRVAILAIIKNGGVANLPEATLNVARDIKSVRDASRMIGLPVPDILEAYQAGYMTELRGDLAPIGIDHHCSPHPVSLFAILSKSEPGAPIGLPLSICKFVFDIELKCRWSAIFASILTGEIKVRLAGREPSGLVQSLRTNSYNCVRQLVKTSPSYPFRDVTLTSAEVGLAFGRGINLGRDLVRYNAIRASLTPGALSSFRHEFVFVSELGYLMHIHKMPSIKIAPVLRRAGVERYDLGAATAWRRSQAFQYLRLPVL